MTTSLRFEIRKGFGRLVRRYTLLSGSILLLLLALFVFYSSRGNLIAQSGIVRTQLKSELVSSLAQADTLIKSPVLWTGLMDSFGRDIYLNPLLKQLNKTDDRKFVLLDYRGRVFTETAGADADAIALMQLQIVDSKPNALLVKRLNTKNSEDWLLVLLPIVSPLSDDPLGYLLLQFSITASIHQLNVDDLLRIDFNLEPKTSAPLAWWYLSTVYEDVIAVGDQKFSYDTRYAVSLLPYLGMLFGLLILTTFLGYLFVRRTESWLNTFSGQLTRQLDQLVLYAKDIFAGNPTEVKLEGEGTDEIGAVMMTFEALLIEQAKNQDRLRKIAYEDPLTGLPTFVRFYELVQGQLDSLVRTKQSFTLLFADVNNLKHINDVYGYAAGNLVIQEAAQLFQRFLPSPNLVSRRSGDEFIAWAALDDQQLAYLAETMGAFEVHHENHPISVGITMGAVRYPQDAGTLDNLMFCAEYALKQAKTKVFPTYVVFDNQLAQQLIRIKQIEERISTALKQSEIKPFYQPVVDMVTGQITGFEALARWQDPQLGWISPDEFVPIAAKLRMSAALTKCMLACIFEDAASIRQKFPGAKIAFNVGPQDVQGTDLMDIMLAYAKKQQHGLVGYELELTEQDIARFDEDIVNKLTVLIDAGAHVAIDDFGTKYSSLSRLTSLPLHCLKIDLSFVANITQPKGEEVVRLIVSLAKSLHLNVTAEGVTSLQQRDLLIASGCRLAQGWLYAKALPLKEVLMLSAVLKVTDGNHDEL